MIKSIVTIFFFAISGYTIGQVEQTGRLEIPIDHEFQNFQVASLDSSGVLTYRRFGNAKGDQLELTRFDTTFQEVWKGYLPVARQLVLSSVKIFRGRIFLFLKPSAGKPDFQVIAMNASNGSYVSYEVKNLIPFNPSEFVVTKNALLIGGYFNYRPIVLHHSLITKKSHVLPGFLNEIGELTQIHTSPNGNIDIIISAKNTNRKKSLWVRSYDPEGNLIKTVVLESRENKNLIFGRAAKINDDTLVIAGVYGRNAEYSRGIFVAEVNAYGEYVIHYYNFADLKNFFHYMKARRENRIKERIERRKMKGKKIKFNYRILVHQLIPYQGKFIMLAEAFTPRYTTRRYSPFMPLYGMPGYTYSPYSFAPSSRYFTPYRNDLVFDGFEYTHAVVLGIDAKGKLVWDNSFQISGIKSFQLEQFVKIAPQQNNILLLYLYENLIRSKVIQGNEVIEGHVQSPIKVNDGDELINSRVATSRLEYWYPHHLYIYGMQRVKEQDPGKSPKLVFFINKLEVK